MPRDAAALAWMANLACLELHPHPVRADDLDHPDELRVDLDPVPGVEWPQIREVARVVRATLARLRPGRLAEDVGLARHARQRAHRAALDVRRGAPRGAGAGARSRAARAGARHQQVVEGRAPRRLHRLQPEREGPHGGRRLLGAAEAGRARVGAARPGTRSTTASRRDFTLATMPARFARGRRSACGHRRRSRARSSALLELSARHEREGLGDAPWPPHYRRSRRASRARVQPSNAGRVLEAPADRDRRARRRRTMRSPGSSAGRRATPRPRRISSRPTSWSTRCAGGFTPGRACASICSTCRRSCGRRRSRSIRTMNRRTWRMSVEMARDRSGRASRARRRPSPSS